MKKIFTLLVVSLFIFAAQAQTVNLSVGAQYANDVYYSMENGTVATVDRSNWDIGFNTSAFSVSIITNQGAGVELYAYATGDTASWATLDTTGMSWTALNNSLSSWDEGAFTQNSLGHPDYGWGIYNMGNHHIVGDSLFVIKTVAGTYKKLWVEQKNAVANTWEFKYANLDGSGEQNVTLNAQQYNTKNFIYYSIDNMQVEDREPASDSWDLLFTKYFDYTIPYSVTGVLTNEAHVSVEQVDQSGMNQATFNTYTEANFSSDISIIGSDWKSFNMGTFMYDLSDTTMYFVKVKNIQGDSVYYKMYFTDFGGSSSGDYEFEQTLLLHTDIAEAGKFQQTDIYPNPVQDQLNIRLHDELVQNIQLMDINGKVLRSFSNLQQATFTMDMEALQSGLYLIQVQTEKNMYTQKIVKQ